MGEYFTKKVINYRTAKAEIENVCKAGVMDDWRYVRRTECEAWCPYDAGEGTNVLEAIQDPSILYRFPFPDEDVNDTVDEFDWKIINDRDMFRTTRFEYKTSLVIVCGERYTNGKARTIFRYVSTGKPFSIDSGEVEDIRKAIIAMKFNDSDSWWVKVAERILSND